MPDREVTASRPRLLSSPLAFLLLLLAVAILRAVYSASIPLTGDEAYHWVWSRHLAFGYYDHPPLVAWLIAFFTRIGGSTLFWTRLTAGLAMAGTGYLTYLLGREIGGEKAAWTAGLFSLALPAMTMGAVVVTTDSPLILFWQLTAYLAWRAVKTERPLYWYLAGVSLGLGLLSKFLIAGLPAALFLFLLLSGEDRRWLRRKEPYLALGLALIIFSPFLVWNSQHGWATFAFNTMRHEAAFSPAGPAQFLGLQALLLSPVLCVLLIWSAVMLAAAGFRPEEAGGRRAALYLLFCGWLLPAFFLFQSLTGEISAHWPVAAYGAALAGLAWVLARRHRRIGGGFWGRCGLIVALVWTIVIVVLTLRLDLLPVNSIAGRTKSQAYGWQDLGRKVSRLAERLGPDYIPATADYSTSSMVSFYTPDHRHIAMIGPGSKYGRGYDLWDHWEAWTGKNVLLISLVPIGPVQREILGETCAHYEILEPVALYEKGRMVREMFTAIGYGLKGDVYTAVRKQFIW